MSWLGSILAETGMQSQMNAVGMSLCIAHRALYLVMDLV